MLKRAAIGLERREMMFGYLIDMDGVIYRDNHLIDGADRFINELQQRGIPFMFLTNNSQRTRRDVATKLRRMGIDVGEEHIYTCAMATAGKKARSAVGPAASMPRARAAMTAAPTRTSW